MKLNKLPPLCRGFFIGDLTYFNVDDIIKGFITFFFMAENMRPHEVLRALKELRKEWRKQNFSYTSSQKARYQELLLLRRARVQQLLHG